MGTKYLRDARHLDKLKYTLTDDLFYEPFEDNYVPSQKYIAIVTDLLKELGKEDSTTTRDGLWFHVYPRHFAWPLQGWKVHVSATMWNGASILKRAAKIALTNEVAFKFAIDRNILSLMSSKRWHRGGSGKFITMYPSDLSDFKNLLEDLYAELRDDEGPYILSDKRYKDCRVLYYRFGGIARNTRMDITGEKVAVLISPSGEAVPDVRTPYFAPPGWVSDPFPSQEPEHQEITLNAGRYLVKRALAFSNSGGVYLAEDRHTGAEVVIKEARAHTVVDDRGNDAIKRLKKEQEILELLRDKGVAPKPVESFQDWENFFLVEEYVDGVDVREIMLTQSPLMRVRPSWEEASRYYQAFKQIVRSLAQAVDVLHQHDIVFGDLSPNNIKIDASTHTVRLIDFEVAYRLGVDKPTYLYTPGFRSIRKNTQGVEDDLYSLAAIMLYMLFPIAAIGSLRGDLFQTVLKVILADVGWSETNVDELVSGLSKGEITCTRVCEVLSKPARILPPTYVDDIDVDTCEKIVQDLGCFILANMHPERKDSLFPADPFLHETNSLSLGFGACGVLYSLKKCGFEIPKRAYDWLEQELDSVKPGNLPPGLFTGASGIAWSLWELGLKDRAAQFMEMANQSAILKRHHSYLYGMAGIGMANLYLHVRTKESSYLAMANDLADALLNTAQESDRGIYWEDNTLVHLGYGYGQSGVALFLLRLSHLSGREKFLSTGRRALAFDLSHGVEAESGVLSFPRAPSDTTIEPYLEEGSAGIAKVAMRYGIWDQMEMILSDVYRKYAGFPGLLYGLGSFIDVLTDAFIFTNDEKFLEMAKRPISGIRDLYLIKQSHGSATPGDGLFRISCDFATGTAGVLRALHRFDHFDHADLVLDDVISAAANRDDSVPRHLQQRAAFSTS